MINLPDYIPNIHPLLVHFPIVIFFVTVLLHVWKIIFAQKDNHNRLVVSGYVLTSIALVFTYLSGRNAVDHVPIPDDALSAVSDHADKALFLMVYGLILAGVAGFLYYQKWNRKKIVDRLLAILGIGGLILLVLTADAGGRLVFGYGVGVNAVYVTHKSETKGESDSKRHELKLENDGSWDWKSGGMGSGSILDISKWVIGNQKSVSFQLDSNGKTKMMIGSTPKELLFTFGPPLDHVKANINIDLSEFDGEFRLIHHLKSKDTYDYLSVAGETISMGRNVDSKLNTFESGKIQSKISSLSVVGDGRHYRGYVNEKVVVHAHQAPLNSGKTGIYINGNGTIIINAISAKNLKKG